MHGRACSLLSSTHTLCQDSEYVVAVRNFINEDRTLLNFHKGDIIRLQHVDGLEAGENQRNSCVFCICEPHSVCLSLLLCSWHDVHLSGSGKHYGCIVRKKVMLLEELKRDTSEFGGFDKAAQSAFKCAVQYTVVAYCTVFSFFCSVILRCLFSLKVFSSKACVTLSPTRFGWVQVGALGLFMENQEPFPVSTSIRWQLRTSWFSRLTAWSLGTDTGKWLHLRPSLWPWGPP